MNWRSILSLNVASPFSQRTRLYGVIIGELRDVRMGLALKRVFEKRNTSRCLRTDTPLCTLVIKTLVLSVMMRLSHGAEA